jgi:hypothetical protein
MRAGLFALAASTVAAWGLFGLFGKPAVERIDEQVAPPPRGHVSTSRYPV